MPLTNLESHEASQTGSLASGLWLDRSRRSRVLESFGFAVAFALAQVLYFILTLKMPVMASIKLEMLKLDMMTLKALLTAVSPSVFAIEMGSEFWAFATPFGVVFWYFAASRRRR